MSNTYSKVTFHSAINLNLRKFCHFIGLIKWNYNLFIF